MHLANGGWGTTRNAIIVRTHCPYCALQCAMRIETTPSGTLAARGDADFDVSAGALCVKGFTAADTLAHPDRLLHPLVRRGGPATASSAAGEPADRVCHCNAVDAPAIVAAIAGGAHDVDAIGQVTLAGTGCGGCKSDLSLFLEASKVAS